MPNPCGDQITPLDGAEAKYGPNPPLQLHANRKFSLLYNGSEGSRCMRRSQFLGPVDDGAKGHTVAGQLQSGQIFNVPQPYSLADETNFPQDWLAAYKLLRVPKVVILSLLPQWSLLWDSCSIIWPRDIIRENPATGDTNNYTYFSQFNGQMSMDPTLRNYQNLGYLTNTWFSNFMNFQAALPAIAAALASGPDPIFLMYPQWLPPARDTQRYWGAVKFNDVFPNRWITSGEQNVPFGNETSPTWCFVEQPVSDPYWYPDGSNPRNYTSYASGGVPCILSAGKPFFGCNVLHLYLGHFCMKIGASNNPFQWESWPTSPEGNWQAHTFSGTYTGNGPTPFFNGRRQDWTIFSGGFGYTGAGGGQAVYNNSPAANYPQYCRGAAAAFKANYYEYRNFATHLFPFPGTMIPGISPAQIRNDRLPCSGYGFWSGFDTLADFISGTGVGSNPDLSFQDITGFDGTTNKVYRSTLYAPANSILDDAIAAWYPLIAGNMNAYYNSLNSGTVDFWEAMVADTCLGDFGFKVNPTNLAQDGDPNPLIEYIRNYFATESPS